MARSMEIMEKFDVGRANWSSYSVGPVYRSERRRRQQESG